MLFYFKNIYKQNSLVLFNFIISKKNATFFLNWWRKKQKDFEFFRDEYFNLTF